MKKLHAAVFALTLSCSAVFAASPMSDAAGLSFQQALDVVSKAGYASIHKIEREKDFYEVEAYDAKGKAIKFKIDPMTGVITPMKQMCHHKAKRHHMKHHKKMQDKPAAPAQ
jgi:hypothetical protein